ncbi:energy-coupled thiamine transporter ThiT [Mycoplasmatota bacterium]|nr:energy-coupled thiamine transporter ThiT [Mycoplasmatota bacterium]
MKVLELVEIAIMIALTAVLEIVFSNTQFVLFPNGGSISISTLPIMVLTLRRGFKIGLIAGVVYGTFQFLLPVNVYYLQPVQYLFDYIVPFVAIAFIGVFKELNVKNIILGTSLAGGLKYLSHVIAGIAYWGEYAPEGFDAVTWSLYYNITYVLPSVVLCAFILVSIFKYNKTILEKA